MNIHFGRRDCTKVLLTFIHRFRQEDFVDYLQQKLILSHFFNQIVGQSTGKVTEHALYGGGVDSGGTDTRGRCLERRPGGPVHVAGCDVWNTVSDICE